MDKTMLWTIIDYIKAPGGMCIKKDGYCNGCLETGLERAYKVGLDEGKRLTELKVQAFMDEYTQHKQHGE